MSVRVSLFLLLFLLSMRSSHQFRTRFARLPLSAAPTTAAVRTTTTAAAAKATPAVETGVETNGLARRLIYTGLIGFSVEKLYFNNNKNEIDDNEKHAGEDRKKEERNSVLIVDLAAPPISDSTITDEMLTMLFAIYCGIAPSIASSDSVSQLSTRPRVLIIGGEKTTATVINSVLDNFPDYFSEVTTLSSKTTDADWREDDYWEDSTVDTIVFDMISTARSSAEVEAERDGTERQRGKITIVNIVGGRGGVLSQCGIFGAPAALKVLDSEIAAARDEPSPDIFVDDDDAFNNNFLKRLPSSTLTAMAKKVSVIDGKNGMEGFWERNTWRRGPGGGVYGYKREGFDDIFYDLEDEDDDFDIDDDIEDDNDKDNDNDDEFANVDDENAPSPQTLVLPIDSTSFISSAIEAPKSSAIVFCSAPFCKLCRKIDADYLRCAREGSKIGDEIKYCKIDGKKNSKFISKELGVSVVPSFIIFFEGVRHSLVLQTGKKEKIRQVIECVRRGDKSGVDKIIEALEEADSS